MDCKIELVNHDIVTNLVLELPQAPLPPNVEQRSELKKQVVERPHQLRSILETGQLSGVMQKAFEFVAINVVL